MAVFESTSPVGAWLGIENSGGGGSRWSVVSSGTNNGEGPNNLLFFSHAASQAKVIFRADGNVGIGSSLPGNVLDVQGIGTIIGGVPGFSEVVERVRRTGSGHTALSVDALAGQSPIVYFAKNGLAMWGLRDDALNGDQFQLRYHGGGAGSILLAVNTTGNVGIGTTTPADRLTVVGGIKVDDASQNNGTYLGGIRFGSGDTGESIASRRLAGANQFGLDFYTSFQNRMVIANSGNVGIGTTAPAAKLDVQGSVRFGPGGSVVNRLEAGSWDVGSSAGSTKVVTIIFPTTFSNPPQIILTARGDDFSDTFVISTRGVTTTSCKINVVRVDSASGWAQDLHVDWMAWE
jgi:hypothetical protein